MKQVSSDLKFKAWDHKDSNMYDVAYLNFHESEIGIYNQTGGVDPLPWDENIEVMQYTGMKDSGGQEIYYEQVVNFYFRDPKDNTQNWGGKAVVTRKMSGGVGLLFDSIEGQAEVVPVLEGGVVEEFWPDYDLWTIEVVGDIYRNPDLVKKA